ncbi:ABC transporter substrate-binding protein [Gardnerella vaginalis]|uniref:ABC transporter substrate-binding protein n=1 Tax=Gardnerella vaginalis TaxID=2702 RepID=A0A3E2CD90_GARVA|nr:ABC transporter substrate-binding protein [Gardnerella vaginalis]
MRCGFQNVKRTAVALVTLATVLLPLGACGNGNSAGKVSISFYSYFKKNQIGNVISAFQKAHPNIKIDAQYGQNSTQYIQTLQTRLAGGTPPTIFNLTMDNRTDIMQSGQALDISGSKFFSGIDESNFKLFQHNGKTYGMPVSAWVGAMFYNKDILKQAGYTEFPKTWDDFITMGKKINDSGKVAFLEDFNTQPSGTFEALLASKYASDKNDKQDEVICNGSSTFSKEWTPALSEWAKAIDAKVIPHKSIGLTADQVKQEFVTGNLAVMRSGPWDLADVKASGINFGVAPMPSYKNGEQWINGGPDQGFAIAAKASKAQQEAAKTFLAYLNSKDGLKTFTTNAGTLSLSDKYRADPPAELAGVIKDYFQNNKFYWVNFSKSPSAMMTEMASRQQELVQGKITPKEFTKLLDDKWNSMK